MCGPPWYDEQDGHAVMLVIIESTSTSQGGEPCNVVDRADRTC